MLHSSNSVKHFYRIHYLDESNLTQYFYTCVTGKFYSGKNSIVKSCGREYDFVSESKSARADEIIKGLSEYRDKWSPHKPKQGLTDQGHVIDTYRNYI